VDFPSIIVLASVPALIDSPLTVTILLGGKYGVVSILIVIRDDKDIFSASSTVQTFNFQIPSLSIVGCPVSSVPLSGSTLLVLALVFHNL
jgi:hypothetical protein